MPVPTSPSPSPLAPDIPTSSVAEEKVIPYASLDERLTANFSKLASYEHFWRDSYSWLKERGYLLRPRYVPGWTPPWKSAMTMGIFEDSVLPPTPSVLDATRVADGSFALLKRSMRQAPGVVSPEVCMFRKLASPPMATDSHNHCISLIEILHVPDEIEQDLDLIVMPLHIAWDRYPLSTVGEGVEFLSQIFEGLQFLHNHNIWHGDCKSNSIVMDASPILKDAPHPWNGNKTRDWTGKPLPARSRTVNPVRYYWIDFDLSGEHDPSKGPPRTDPCYGGTRGVPEWAFPEQQCNPFAVDVWCLGKMVHRNFISMTEECTPEYAQEIKGFEFMRGLLADMAQEDPAKRPTMDGVVERFSTLKAGLSGWKLRSRFTREKENIAVQTLRTTRHWATQLYFTGRRIPAIPSV
ncbi:hypothetical protein DFH06DRAFT_1477850 [Mycena polygramma]|nr:hypothetical protein DFH06DRAFT_1477850 [Mycena polygramma]